LSWWASKATAPEIRQERGQKASEYYARAVKLSPNNSNLWNEWAILFMDVLRQPDQALQRLNQALELDDQYSWTYSIFADYYIRQARSTQDDQVKEQAYTKAIESLEDAVRVATGKETQAKISYLVSLGNLYIEMANRDPQNINRSILGQAIVIYEQAIALEPKVTDRWKIEEQISRLYVQLGDKVNALIHANAALEIVPEQQQERIQTLINQIRSLP
jgi:tetratricopeptide (TPR) repeat protein